MELRALRYFVKVVELGSFAKAARQVHITQPALSIAIRKLEKDLDAPLLDRTSAGVLPTLFGRSLYENASRAIRDLNRAREALKTLRNLNNGRLTICVGPTVPGAFLMRVVFGILSDYPGFEFRLLEGTYSQLYQALISGEADVILAQFPRVHDDPLITNEVILEGEHAVVARAQHPLARQSAITPIQLVKYPWIFDKRTPIIVPDWADRFRQAGVEPPRAAIDMSSPSLAKIAMLTADYLTMLPLGYLVDEIQSGRIVRLAVSGFSWVQEVGASYRSEITVTPALRLFLERIRAEAKPARAATRRP